MADSTPQHSRTIRAGKFEGVEFPPSEELIKKINSLLIQIPDDIGSPFIDSLHDENGIHLGWGRSGVFCTFYDGIHDDEPDHYLAPQYYFSCIHPKYFRENGMLDDPATPQKFLAFLEQHLKKKPQSE